MEKIEAFTEFLKDRKTEVLAEVSALAAENKKDESNVLKAKANIYDISKAFFDVAVKNADEASLKDEFLNRFSAVTRQWEASLEQAKAHEDAYKILIEEAKFEAVDEIKEKAEELL